MILLVDDTPENLYSLKTLLHLNAYDVDTAASGEEALRKILKNEYAVIILDVQMPEMDGYEVAEAITGFNKTRDIPIIFLSAINIDKRFVLKGYASGGVDYITKPFDPDFLLLKVKTFYRLYEQQRNLKAAEQALRNEVDLRNQAQQQLQQLNQSLEEKVKLRTKDLEQVNHDLENRNAELAQYASLASHDLQEPLRKIMTFSNRISEFYLADKPDAQKEMEKVISSAHRMRRLIDDLLNYSRLSVTTLLTSTDLNKVLNETLTDLEISITEKNAKVSAGPLPQIEAVPGQMRQLFQNLLTNALKFSSNGQAPAIEITGEKIASKNIDAPADATGQWVRITIRDNGIGFSDIYRDKIFLIFERLHDRSEYEGTGIGLAIVKKITERHNGLITATATEGKGATFIIVLPVKQPDAILAEKTNPDT